MERFTERSRKETVKGRLALRELEVKRQPFPLPLYSSTTRSPTLAEEQNSGCHHCSGSGLHNLVAFSCINTCKLKNLVTVTCSYIIVLPSPQNSLFTVLKMWIYKMELLLR